MRRRRRPGIHFTAERVAKWIPGSRYARPGMTGARGETWMAGTSPAMTGGGGLYLWRRQILHLHAVALLDDLGDHLAVAMRVVALVAHQAHWSGLLHQRRQLVELF